MIAETLEYFVIAFISSAVLIVLSKIILQNLIRRPADYYLAEELRQEEMMLNSAGFSITEEIETNPEGEVTSEHISVTPQLTVDETVDMHLIERENIPERFIEESDHIKRSDDDAGEGANAASDELKEIFRDFPESAGSAETHESSEEGSDKAGSDTDHIPEMDELREIILGNSREDTVSEGGIGAGMSETDNDTDSSEAGLKNKENKEKKEKQDKEKAERKRGRHPSMKMRKDELLAIAAERGVDIPEKVTKKEIIELINANEPENNKNGNDRNRNKNRNNQSRNKTGNNKRSNQNGKKKQEPGENKNSKKKTKKKQEHKQNQKQDQKTEK